jgi:hypothetical protein
MFIWVAFLLFILYAIVKSCWNPRPPNNQTPRDSNPGPTPGGGWFPGGPRDPYDHPPPPYSKDPSSEARRPGFWSGAALGGLAAHLLENRGQRQTREDTGRSSLYWDWEQPYQRRRLFGMNSARAHSRSEDDRGEGPSNLGSMRRGIGLGGTNVR